MTLPPASSFSERRLLAGSLAGGLLHYLFFCDRSWGISFPLFVLAFYLLLLWTAGTGIRELRSDRSSIWLLPIGLLSLTYALYTNPVFAVLNALAIPLLIVQHTTTAYRADRPPNPLASLLEQVLVQSLLYVPRPAALVFGWLSSLLGKGSSRAFGKVLLGFLLAAPLLGAVLWLLASADAMFSRSIRLLPDLLNGVDVFTAVMRILWVLFIMTGLFAYIAGLLRPKLMPSAYRGQEEQSSAGGSRPPETGSDSSAPAAWDPGPPAAYVRPRTAAPRMDATVAATMLILLNSVYLLFVFIQFSYFFGGGAAELPEGVTYAAYARRGFAELVVVTLINLSVLVGALYGIKRPSPPAWTWLRALLALLVGCTGVMLSSAYIRLSMYEEAYGYTIARLLVHAFMIFLLVLFILALVKLWSDRLPLGRSYLIAAVASYIIVNYIGIDAMIVKNNVVRYEQTGVLDADYLSSLGYEAVPHLLELNRRRPEAAGEALQEFRSRLEKKSPPAWTEFNLSKWRAWRDLQAEAATS
ncbi:protein of unknown function [Paenibacillus sp. UNCCL117]|uniref:DUF4153 domain-containing protein n=1 Tax=unclassified Paenibacillus TaxID=185978 RepID=UPI00088F4A93|nr:MULTISPECIES: DUF4173 domain-containing protein [unclassified Paenibacillus]SDE30439.1 protein of unknown function [Paenibacillus sp. cl123]SFW63079.1 protein of unknown function [Paenibacillus sp. UNCCL117]